MIKPRHFVSIAQSAAWKPWLLSPLLAVALLAGVSLVALSGARHAAAFDSTYTVEAGDTLYAIAISLGIADGDLDDWVDQVVVLNDLADADTIIEGQVLTIPIGGAGSSDEPAGTGGSLTPLEEPAVIIVEEGDTLLGIAIELGVSDEMAWVDDVVELNGLESADVIAVGQVLQLPAGTPSAGTDASPAASSNAEAATADGSLDGANTYLVEDASLNLFSLATSLGIPDSEVNAWVEATVALNSLDANGLYPGDVIQLPQPGSY